MTKGSVADEPRAGVWRLLLAGALALLVAGLAVTAGILGTRVRDARAEAKEHEAATQVARQMAINLSSMDYRHIQQGIDRVLSGLTGDAKDQWGSVAKTISDTATKSQSVSTVQSVKAGVVSMDGDSAEVIAATTSLTTSPKMPQGQPRSYRWRFDLTRTDGRWLVSKLGLVP